ncbi:MAG: YegP family protein [Bacilli bacterium]|nr:YegP family protein [Bacilli bacterium]
MDKKERRKVVTGVILLILAIAIAAGTAIWIMNSGIPEIQLGNGSAAYNDFIRAITFNRDITEPIHKWIVFGATVGIYLGLVLFVADFVVLVVRRSMRFVFLPIAGICAFEAVAFMDVAFFQLMYIRLDLDVLLAYLMLGLMIALLAIGLASFVLGIVFPRRLVTAEGDEEKGVLPNPEEESKEKPVFEEEPQPQQEEVPAVVAKEEPAPEKEEEPQPEPAPEPQPEPEPEPEPEEPKQEAKEAKKPAKPAKKAAAKPAEESKPKAVGKYEVFPEAGFFKYRLKANNGEILVVSNPYKTKESALAGIETLKKNIPLGNAKIITDKNGFGQFRIFTGNDSRLVVAGEIYPTALRAENALNSTMKFYDTDRVNVLDEIPESEHREWGAFNDQIQPAANGKIAIEAGEDGKYTASLFANNGELLFATTTYATKASLKKALDNIKEKLIKGETMTIAKDKQNRYQFRLYSDNGMLLLMGQTYPSRDAAEKALRSTRNFIGDAKIVGE